VEDSAEAVASADVEAYVVVWLRDGRGESLERPGEKSAHPTPRDLYAAALTCTDEVLGKYTLANEKRLRDSVRITRTARDKGWDSMIKLSVYDNGIAGINGAPLNPNPSQAVEDWTSAYYCPGRRLTAGGVHNAEVLTGTRWAICSHGVRA
jgi:hypothetical protein